MTIARLLPLHIHGAVEAVLAVVIMAAPFVLGFDAVAMIASLILGGLILAVALATHAGEEPGLAVSTHIAFDLAFAIALGAGAVAFAIVQDVSAAAFLAAGAVGLTLLASLTRYSPGRA
jgi:hypothetical protein